MTLKFLVSTPLKISKEPKYAGWKMSFLFKQVIFRFHVNFPGVYSINYQCLPRPLTSSTKRWRLDDETVTDVEAGEKAAEAGEGVAMNI